ncbi:NADP(H)-dependent aldo-keto reductase [Magnetovibrio blakemorei]|uniref:Protein tas n=1 Tax=Magnetovibrio blakemorei TaxID=28181 RepID=A0A1E5Q377_9PROT|nr:NADP(H)-dependent aldo-keto reductase [Magnetovibrio blakemorei]OEJ64065.1 aldo/keto reductase [Magnetovibrio blakemorei]
MIYNRLGRTDLQVSRMCLGSMTWGRQNSQDEAFAQMDYALDQGINFIDTAELYAVPPSAETYGASEKIIGAWFKARGRRDKVILASKVSCKNVSGQNPPVDYMREGDMKLDRANMIAAVDASLQRLQTDYIDLYQVHWPERRSNFFGKLGYESGAEAPSTPIEETLEVLTDLVKAGKIRAVGVSNETPWGVMKYLQAADKAGLARIASVQNPYSLLNRTYEVGLAEVSQREDCGLLAYSPLAFGVLSGKYLGGERPEGARLTLFSYFTRYVNDLAAQATARYVQVARDFALDPAQMALAFINQQAFLTANIIGATTMDQLKSNVASGSLTLSDEVLQAIGKIHRDLPNPAP